MNPKPLLLLVLGMVASFLLVLGVMWMAVSPAHAPRERRPVARVLRVPPEDPEPRRQRDGTVPASRDETRRASPSRLAGRNLPLPPRQELVQAEAPLLGAPARLERRTRAAADSSSRHLSQVEESLQRQVQALRESRNRMLDDLGEQLEAMAPAEAARDVAILDDETAALALRKLSAGQRQKVLAALDPARSRRLTERIKQLGSK